MLRMALVSRLAPSATRRCRPPAPCSRMARACVRRRLCDGTTEPGRRAPSRPWRFAIPALSGDGQRVALTMLEEQATSPDIWILEIARGTFTRVSRDQATDWFPVWAPDGQRLFFGSARARATTLYQKDLRGTSAEEALHPPPSRAIPWMPPVTGGSCSKLAARQAGVRTTLA